MVTLKNRINKLNSIISINATKGHENQIVDNISNTSASPSDYMSFDFSTSSDSQGWLKNYANYLYNDHKNEYGLVYDSELANIPEPLDTNLRGIRLKINNAYDGDFFAYVYKNLTLTPCSSYNLKFIIHFATDISKTRSDYEKNVNGKNLTLKVGATDIDNVSTFPYGTPPRYQTKFDLGDSPTTSGSNAIFIKDIHNNTETDEFVFATILTDAIEAKTDKQGNVCVFLGAHSDFNGLLDFYITEIDIIGYMTSPTKQPKMTISAPTQLSAQTLTTSSYATATLPGTSQDNSISSGGVFPISIKGAPNLKGHLICNLRETGDFFSEVILLCKNNTPLMKIALDKSYSSNNTPFMVNIEGTYFSLNFGQKIPFGQKDSNLFKIEIH